MNFVDMFDQPPSNNLSPDILIRVVKDSTNIREIFPKHTCNVYDSKQMIYSFVGSLCTTITF